MRAKTIKIKPMTVGGHGPSDYFFSKQDSRGNLRDPAPKLLYGNPEHFERCVRRSKARHPYTSYVLSYKGEPNPPSTAVRQQIHSDYLRLLRAGLSEDRVVALGVDHGEDEHGAILRNLVEPAWRRFQPYFHPADQYVFSDFQWIVNRRYRLLAPENPESHQLISLAGKHFNKEHELFIQNLRAQVEREWEKGGLKNRMEFLHWMARKNCRISVVKHPQAQDSEMIHDGDIESTEKRVWLEVKTDDGFEVLLKSPLCDPRFVRSMYEANHNEDLKTYGKFLDDPYPLWNRFMEGVRIRRQKMRRRFLEYCDELGPDQCFGFQDLYPSQRLVEPALL